MDQPTLARLKAALERANSFSAHQIRSQLLSSMAAISYKVAMRNNEDTSAVEDSVEQSLDAQQGYKQAHSWTRGTSKASPPLHIHVEERELELRHPH